MFGQVKLIMKTDSSHFDAVVIGGGHAGVEALRALCAMGHRTALVSLDTAKIGAMSCNPAIGGVAKSHLVYEIDALGGQMGWGADLAGIQSRRLNLNKGPAVRSTRVQCDKDVYAQNMSEWAQRLEFAELVLGEASGLIIDNGSLAGVRLRDGSQIFARVVVVSAGTFMRGLMFCGTERNSGGRFGDSAAELLSQDLLNIGHGLKRLKTGTPARLDAKSIDFGRCARQWGDPEQRKFSWRKSSAKLPQLCCYLTHTSEKTHDIIRRNFSLSPLFSGDIQGVGPRYCPSVEDKVKRFPERDRHQIFLEPEGLNTNSIYPNGLSTCLPASVQLEFLRSIEGLERVELLRPGYAVEYDTVNPTELLPSFMSSRLEGLFFAGQVNRTSGYEEAAAQGLWAGLNAGLLLRDQPSLKPDRSRSYMETLADDLTSVGTEEPYRMFTSRSEYRLLLREDNAAERMHALGISLGLIAEEQRAHHESLLFEVRSKRELLLNTRKRLDVDRVVSLFEYLKRPEVSWESFGPEIEGNELSDLALEKLEVEAKYSGYLHRQEQELIELKRISQWRLSSDFDYSSLAGISTEILEKIERMKPTSVADLASISGMTPGAILAVARRAGRTAGAALGGEGIVSRETVV